MLIILGFGRSGTTWISDIISKVTGSLILFEPLHPSVTDLSRNFSYSAVANKDDSIILKDYLENVLNKRHRKMWLMRNHVPTPLENVSHNFLEVLWEECSVIGFKEIRANFMIPWLRSNLNAKIIFVVRHPLAVVSSILKRSNFWEFGWPDTYELFLEKTIYNSCYKDHEISTCIDLIQSAKTTLEKITVMWAVTHAIALPELKKLNLPFFYYEDIYCDPFSSIRNMFRYLGYNQIKLHPSYLFTPSMTTLKTIHGLYSMEERILSKNLAFFWERILSEKEIGTVMDIVGHFRIHVYDDNLPNEKMGGLC
jgi:hypothetical protein